MKYIKYFLILTLTILALNSCSNNTEEYQIQVKEELTEYLYSVETETGRGYKTNYEYAEEVIEDYSLKTTKRRHVKSNIKKGKEVLDKIILPKEKSDEIKHEIYKGVNIDSINLPLGRVIGVFGDVVFYCFHNEFLGDYINLILDYEFLFHNHGICAYYNGTEICIHNPYLNLDEYNMLFSELLNKEDVELMLEVYKSWFNIYYREFGIDNAYDDLHERYKNGEFD